MELLLGGGLDIGLLVNGIELAALDGVEEDLGGLLDALEEVVVLGAASGGLLIGVVLENLLAVSALDLLLSGPPAVLGKAENLVVILLLYTGSSRLAVKVSHGMHHSTRSTNLPVLGVAREHHGVLGLAEVALVILLDVLGTFLGLDTVILGEGALVAGATGVGEEVRADGLDGALGSLILGNLADGLEVLLGGPALREGRERKGNHSSHFCG